MWPFTLSPLWLTSRVLLTRALQEIEQFDSDPFQKPLPMNEVRAEEVQVEHNPQLDPALFLFTSLDSDGAFKARWFLF